MSNDIEQAYELGWRRASEWAKRDDLVSDIGSPAYKRDRAEDLAHLSAQAKVRVTDQVVMLLRRSLLDAGYKVIEWEDARSALEACFGSLSQGAQGEAVPAFWAAVAEDGEIVVSYSADDGNNGEASRKECNDYINDALLSDCSILHLVPLYTHPAERAAVPDDVLRKTESLRNGIHAASCRMPEGWADVAVDWQRDAQAILDWLTAAPQPPEGARVVDGNWLDWSVGRWMAEVSNRPLVNKHRRSLDDAWRQVIRHAGGDDVVLCGPRHDDLASAPTLAGKESAK